MADVRTHHSADFKRKVALEAIRNVSMNWRHSRNWQSCTLNWMSNNLHML
jgi:hypothetical protein